MRGNVLQKNKRVLPKNGSGHIALHINSSGSSSNLLQEQKGILFKKSGR
jgi:hypothetical protein